MMIKKRIINITVHEFNKKLRQLKKERYNIHINEEQKGALCWDAYIVDKISKIELTFKDRSCGLKAVTYVCDKSESHGVIHEKQGMEAYATSQKYYKTPHVCGKEDALFSASGILYYNKKYVGTRQHAYGYDLNSAFPYAMLKDMPANTENGPINKDKHGREFNRMVKKGEIGFTVDGGLCLPGEYASYIFKSEKSPYERFVNTWYNKKKNARDAQSKTNAKDILNMCVGFMQRHNFWIRAAIIGYSNRLIQEIINKYPNNILLSNTDSIVSTCRIPEIEANIGKELGQWKFEHEGEFAYVNSNYQWDYKIPTYRGVPKNWFKDGYDILKDKLPENNNHYIFDMNTVSLKKIIKNEVR